MSEWYRDVAAPDGSKWNVLRQDEEAECGFCCVAMVINIAGDGSFPPTSSMIKENTHRYDRSTKDRPGMVATALVPDAEDYGEVHHGGGTDIYLLGDLLTTYGVNCTVLSAGGVKSAMQHVTPAKPMIVLVQWTLGGGHWVVVVKRKTRGLLASSDYTILDPANGTIEINRGSVNYNPLYGNSGYFDDWYLTT